MEDKNIPTNLKILSGFYFLTALYSLLYVIDWFIAIKLLGNWGDFFNDIIIPFVEPFLNGMSTGNGLVNVIGEFNVIHLAFITIAFITFIIGVGLLNNQKWAWILAIFVATLFIFVELGIIIRIFPLYPPYVIPNILSLIINLTIVIYLIMNKKIKANFA